MVDSGGMSDLAERWKNITLTELKAREAAIPLPGDAIVEYAVDCMAHRLNRFLADMDEESEEARAWMREVAQTQKPPPG